jgi:type IV pilus assembly protein PilY1
MNTVQRFSPSNHQASLHRASAILVGFFATLINLPAAAASINYPNVPLQSGSTVPPNILFILDDSGSMGNNYMPKPGAASDTPPTTSTAAGRPDIGQRTSALNGVYYDPRVTYQPWRLANKLLATDPGPKAAYTSNTSNIATDGTVDLTASVQTFYVPKGSASDLDNAEDYYRYQILTNGDVYQSKLVPQLPAENTTLTTTLSAAASSLSPTYSFDLPSNASNLAIRSAGGSSIFADLYVGRGFVPTTGAGNSTCRSRTAGTSTELCSPTPTAATYNVRIHGNGGAANNVNITITYDRSNFSVTGGCTVGNTSGWDWSNCTKTTPDSAPVTVPASTPVYRSDADEMANYATWYSFHRTRNKTAKAGASQAFSDLGENLRVGFNTIWRRNTFDIPVTQDGGLFRDTASPAITNRTDWFDRLFAAIASNGTPLKGALQTAGTYYARTDSAGPYGPESGSAQLACRQNFAILTTDGFWNNDTNFTSASVNNSDNTAGSPIPLAPGATGTPFTYSPVLPFNDGFTSTLADVAMQYWKTDLRTDLDNLVPKSSDDPAYWQHMTTFGISIGLQGTLNPKTDLPAINGGTKAWPDPTITEDATRIDDLWHASVNGHGDFVAATNAAEFSEGLKSALASIGRRLASGSSVATTGPRVTTGTKAFAASYFSGSWTGDVAAYSVTAGAIGATPLWSAAAKMPLVGARKIFSYNGTAGIPFAWASLTPAQQTALGSQTLFDYVRGVRTEETATVPLRARDTLLGDIVNSSPEYLTEPVGSPAATFPAVDTVFVGANDGMLHAFDGATGVEQFAYVPGGISFGDLKSLSTPSYAHYFFVDGPLVVSKRAQSAGQNILVGALGRGGKGVYALDVTDPTNFSQTKVLWDRSNDVGMGNVLGKPIIAKLNNGVTAVIVPNGINSSTDKPALFIYDLKTGAPLTTAPLAITGASYGSAANPNGLSAPKGWDADGDGDVDYVYAGDLLGNMWRFDLTGVTPLLWTAPTVPLFSAKDSGGKEQPITGGISIALDPTTFDTWVFFGTGRFLTGNDLNSTDIQTWYGVRDSLGTLPATPLARADLKTRQIVFYQPAAAAVVGPPAVAAKAALRAFGPAVVGDMALKSGWYVDLINPPYATADKVGERMVFDPILVGGTVLVEASQAPSKDPCTPGGTGYINVISAFTGGSVLSPFFDSNRDGVVTAADTVTVGGKPVPVGSIDPGVGMPSTPAQVGNVLIIGGSAVDKPVRLPIADTRVTGRISWREILRD